MVVGRDAGDAQADLLQWLRHVYEVIAWEAPCLDAVPLLAFAGWTDGAALVLAPISTYAAQLPSLAAEISVCVEHCQVSRHTKK